MSAPGQAFGVCLPFTVRVGGAERRVRSALIPARTRHRVIAEGRVLFAYVDPGSEWVTRTSDRMMGRLGTILVAHDDELGLARRLPSAADPYRVGTVACAPGCAVDRRAARG